MDNLQQWTKTFAFVFGLMASNAALCQTRTVEFEDGNKLDYTVLSESCVDMKPLWLHWGVFNEGALYGFQFDKWVTDKGLVQLTTSLIGTNALMESGDSLYIDGKRPAGRSWRLRGHYFLNSWTKTKTKKISLDSKSTGYNEITKYVMDFDIPRKSYLAVHGGFSYQNLGAIEAVKYSELALGLSLLRARHIDFEIYNASKSGARRMRGASFMELYADALIFMNPGAFTVAYAEELVNDGLEPRPLGMEIAWKGMATSTGKGGFGMWLKAGFMVGPYRSSATYGAGFSFALMDDKRKI